MAMESLERHAGEPQALETTVTEVTQEGRLPLLQQVAEQTGFSVAVVAREGEQHSFWGLDYEDGGDELVPTRRVKRTTTIQPGFIAVSISKPGNYKGDHEPFWNAYNVLRQAPPQPQE